MCVDRHLSRRLARVPWLLAALVSVPACQRASDGDAAVQSAAQTFTTVCARCHGSDGKGGVGPEGRNAPRNFCDASFQASRTDEQLKSAIRKGKGGMPPFGNMFPDPVLAELVRKIRSFDPATKAR